MSSPLRGEAGRDAEPGVAGPSNQRGVVALAMSLFFAFGFCTVLVDTLVPKLKALFQLTYTEVMLTQFCFFFAYFVVSLPAGRLLARIGYLRAVTVGLLIMAVGCLLFSPAARVGTFSGFLGALFILASGVTLVQVAANPLAARAGGEAGASSRLTLAQALNSLATMVGPLFGAWLILGHDAGPPPAGASPEVLAQLRGQEALAVEWPFIGIALALLVLAAVCWRLRRIGPPVGGDSPAGGFAHLLRHKRLVLGALSIFTYVGAEVSIGSALTNYLMQPSTLGASLQNAGALVSVYWGLAMVGRFAGSAVLRAVSAGRVLAACAVGAIVMLATSGLSAGMLAAASLLAVGLFNSIMFPTIFSLGIDGLGDETAPGSGLLCLAIVGGAIVPVLFGSVADHGGLAAALAVPGVCYVWIALYGLWCARRPGSASG